MTKESIAAFVVLVGLGFYADASAQTITVVEGDTLSGIAQRVLGDPDRWTELCEINKETLKNCNIIQPGNTLLTAQTAGGAASSEIDVVLKCEAVGQNPIIERTLRASMKERVLAFSRGTPGAHGYERWTGKIGDDGKLVLAGEYVEGSPETKRISMTGDVTRDGAISASGTRGPRNCTLNSQPKP